MKLEQKDFIDVEKEFGKFVIEFGGEHVDTLFAHPPNFKNADYLFKQENIVAELKRIESNFDQDPEFQKKIQVKFDKWINEGIIGPIYGKVRVDSKNLPMSCQKELLELYKRPFHNHVKKANKQVKQTKDYFGLKDAKGLLVIVNDGNYAIDPYTSLYSLWRTLGADFKALNSVVFLTVNVFSKTPITSKPSLLWVHLVRADEGISPISEDFIQALNIGWSHYLAKNFQIPIENIDVKNPSVLQEFKHY